MPAQRHDTLVIRPVKRLPQRHGTLVTPAIKKAASCASSKARYISDPASKKAASKAQYLIILLPRNLPHVDTINLTKIVPVLAKGTGMHWLSLSLM